MVITAVKVMGDSGKEYTITAEDDGPHCNCPSFVFSNKGTCKHVAFAASALKRA